MTDTVIRSSPLDAVDIGKSMNIKFDTLGAQAGIDAGYAWLEHNKLNHFPLAEANAVMATMFLHINDPMGFLEFKAAMMDCEDFRDEHVQEPYVGPTETIRLNLQRNFANWLYRKGMFEKAEGVMDDEGFKSPTRPIEEQMADRLIRRVGRLLNGDMRAAGMLERLFHKAYELPLANKTYLHNICWWAIFALCAAGRGKDAEPLARMLTGEKEDSVVGPDPSEARRKRAKLLMSLRFNWLRKLAAKYAISKYRLK